MTRHATSKTEDGRGLVKHALACTPRNLKSYFESRAAHRTTRELQPVVDAEQELLVSASQNPHILRDSFEEDLACILILMKEEMRGSPKHPLASDFGLLYAIYIGIQIAKNANGGPLRPEEVGDIFRSLTDEIRESWLDWPPASEDLSEPPPMWAHFLSRCDGASSEHRDAMAKRLWFVQVTACLATHISLPWTRTKAHVSWPPTLDGSKNRHRQNRIRSDFDVARLHETIDHEALDALAVVLAYVLDHADNLRDFGRSRSGKIFGVLPGEARSPGESSTANDLVYLRILVLAAATSETEVEVALALLLDGAPRAARLPRDRRRLVRTDAERDFLRCDGTKTI